MKRVGNSAARVKSAGALVISGALVLGAWWAYSQSNLPIAGELTTLHQHHQDRAGYQVATFYTPGSKGESANFAVPAEPTGVRLEVSSGCLVAYLEDPGTASPEPAAGNATQPYLVVVPLGSFVPADKSLRAADAASLPLQKPSQVALGYSLTWLERLTVAVDPECAQKFPERVVFSPASALADRLAHWADQPT